MFSKHSPRLPLVSETHSSASKLTPLVELLLVRHSNKHSNEIQHLDFYEKSASNVLFLQTEMRYEPITDVNFQKNDTKLSFSTHFTLRLSSRVTVIFEIWIRVEAKCKPLMNHIQY